MSDDFQYIDVNDEQWDGTPRALREALDKAQKALKAEKTATAELRGHVGTAALSGVLTGFRNPDKVKADILAAKVDPLNSEAVNTWLSQNGDDYARATGSAEPSTDATQAQAQARVPDYAALNGLAEVGTPAGADASQVIASMPEGLSKQEAYQWLAARA